jgi:hypothetical protein
MADDPIMAKLNLLEGLIFEILRQATPPEAVPFVAQRLAANVPSADAAAIIARLTRPEAP